MKNLLQRSLALGLLLSVAGIKGDALDNKIKTVNSQMYLMESAAGKEAVATLQNMRVDFENQLKGISMELQRIEGEATKLRADAAAPAGKKALASGGAQAASQADTERKLRDLEYKKNELQAKGQRIVQDGQNDMMMKEQELLQPVLNDFAQAVAQYAKEKDLFIVIDEASGRVVYKKDGLDATSDVMKIANKQHEQKVTLAKNKAAAPAKPASTKVA